MPPESLNYIFALARTGYRSEFFCDFGKVTKIGIQTSIKKNLIFLLFFCFSGAYTGRGVYPKRVRNSPEGKNI